MTRALKGVWVVSVTALFCTALHATDQAGSVVAGQVVGASTVFWTAGAAPSRNTTQEVSAPATAGRELQAALAGWLEHVGVGRASLERFSSRADAPDPSLSTGDVAGVVGTNIPISTYPDDVTNTEGLEKSSLAYNFNFPQYMVAWHAKSRSTDYDVFGRLTSPAGTNPSGVFVISQDAGLQIAPSVAYDAAAVQYFVTWSDLGTGTTGTVRLRRFASTGAPAGDVVTVSGAGTNAYASRVACGGGRCIVVWQNDLGNGNSQILARSYDSAGNSVAGPVVLSDTALLGSPDVAFSPAINTFLVAWEQSIASWYDIVGVGVSGSLGQSARVTISGADGHQRYPRVAFSQAAGCYLVVWQDGRSKSNWDVWGQRVGSDISLQGGNINIFSGAFNESNPTVAGLDTTSQFAVVYATDTNGGGLWQIHACLVSGGGSVGGQFSVRDWNNQRRSPAVAARLGASDYLVTWTDSGEGTTADILGQVVKSDATLFGSMVAIGRGRKGQERPAVAFSPAHNEHLVVWMDYRNGVDYQIWGRRVLASGNLVGDEFAIGNESGSMLYGFPSAAYDPSTDEYLVVWQEIHSQTTGYDVYARRVGGNGTLPAPPFLVSRDSNARNEGTPRVSYNAAANEFLVGWNAFDDKGSLLWRVWGQRVSAGGALSGSGFLISASNGNCSPPRVAANAALNQHLVIWEDLRGGGDGLFGQRVNGDGTPAGANFPISINTGTKLGFALAWGGSGSDYLAVWGDTGSGTNINGQHIDGNGTLVGGAFAIADTGAAETDPAIAFDATSGGFIVGWVQRGATNDSDVWARPVPKTGSPTEASFALTTAVDDQYAVDVAQDTNSGQFLFVWQDFRASSYDIYGQLAATCTVTCSATVPGAATKGVEVPFAGAATTGCPGSPVYDWDFGDGTPHGTTQNPGHTYLAAGTYTWKLTVSVAGGASCTNGGTITVGDTPTCTVTCSASVPTSGFAGTPVSFSGSGVASGCAGSLAYDWDFGDGAPHGTTQSQNHTYAMAGTYTWKLTVSVAGGGSCFKSGVITIGGPAACTLNCSASVAASGSVNIPVTFSGSAVVSGCVNPVAYDWDFGDNSAHGSTQDTSHSYLQAGTYYWRMTASAGAATCVQNGVLLVSGATQTWVPVVSHLNASVGGWRSDLGILNRSSLAPANVSLTLHATGRDLTGSVTVAPKGQEILRDVALLLGLDSGSGSLEVRADQSIIVTSRTYNLQESGWTYGQGYEGLGIWEGLSAGQSAYVPQLTQNGSSGQPGTYRSNVGLTNLGSVTANVTLELYAGASAPVLSATRDLAPGQWSQFNEPFRLLAGRTDVVKGYAVVRVNSGTSVFVYGSLIDNGSFDPTTIAMRRSLPPSPGGQSVSWVPVISHAGSFIGGWRSDTGILNPPGAGTATVNLVLRTGSRTLNGSVTVPDGGQEILRDAALLLGLDSGSGSLELVADRPVVVTSRTYNLQDTGWTYGQGYEGYTLADGLVAGQSAFLPQLTQNGSPGQVGTYRSNIGVTNMGTASTNVTLTLYDALGNEVYTSTRDIGAGQWTQFNEPYRIGAGRSDVAKGYARITVNSGANVIAYASVIDNGSSDPTTIEMRR